MLSQPRGEGAVWNEEHAGPGCPLGGDGPPGVRWWSPRCSFVCLRMHLGSWLARCMALNQPGREKRCGQKQGALQGLILSLHIGAPGNSRCSLSPFACAR